jgi:factor associated with neutral sphingomyelinase activation
MAAVSGSKKWIRTTYNSFSSERFSPLLLEAYEYYFEDYSVTYFPVSEEDKIDVDRKSRGRLKLCSNSLVYDPLDYALPVVKLPFRECVKILECDQSGKRSKGHISSSYFLITVKKHCTMLQNGTIGPYNYIKREQTFMFQLNFGDLSPVLADICTFYGASKLNVGERDRVTLDVLKSRYSKLSFNMSWLEELQEKIIVEMAGEKVTPMVGNPGRVLLTSHRLYFQPFNNAEVEPVLKIHLRDLKSVLRRRYILRHLGIELITKNGDNMFLVFETTQQREKMFEKVLEQPGVAVEDMNLEELTVKWQCRELSNYDYLMSLNVLADRSSNDIIQYPVFPWIIADYESKELDLTNPRTFRDLSKPIGALNEERLAFFKKRYQETPGKRFLYGTHYSAPAFVLYYLVRAAPEYLLCLQNGHFDHPNRMFHSVAGTWSNVLTSATDVKELIPEFYEPPGDFLLNAQNLDLGTRSEGVKLGDVVLPPWAKDARDFTSKCRQALESDYVSRHLHLWIDLVFGYKQRGREALKADNVFHYLSYEGAVNLEEVKDSTELASLQVQIREFGQTPKQLFFKPHQSRYGQKTEVVTPESPNRSLNVSKLETSSLESKDADSVSSLSSSSPQKKLPWDQLAVSHMQKMHKDPITDVKISADGSVLYSTSTDKNMKAFLLESKEFTAQASLSHFPLSSVAVLPDSKTVLLGCWDNFIYAYSIEFGAKLSKTYAHDSSGEVAKQHPIVSTILGIVVAEEFN